MEEKKSKRGILSYKNEMVEKFMDSICPCRWIIVTPEHKKKDCPHYTFSLEKELLHEGMDNFMKDLEKVVGLKF